MENKELEKIKKEIRDNFEFLRKTYRVKKIGIFGSFARGEQTKKSDVDILVEFSHPRSVLELVRMEYYLSDKLHRKIDLVPKNGLKKAIKNKVLNHVIYV